MENHRESGTSVSGVETTLPDIVLKDDDGKEFRAPGSLMGKWLPLVGRVDKDSIENNHDLLVGLKAGWFKEDGTLSETGEAEAARRAGATKKAGEDRGWSLKTPEANKEAEIIKARKGLLGTIQRKMGGSNEKKNGDPKAQVTTALEKYGYEGDAELTVGGVSKNYVLKFTNTKKDNEKNPTRQVEEGKILTGTIAEILNKIDQYIGKLSK